MDAASLMLPLLGALVMACAQVVWEVTLHRRTMRHTTAETGVLMARVNETVDKAEKDREAILAAVASVRSEVAGRVDRVLEAVERETRERIEKANAVLAEREAEIQAEVEAANARIAEERAQMQAALEEARRSEQMRKRGAIGNASQEAARQAAAEAPSTAGELVALLESKVGPAGVEALRSAFPFAWEQAESDPSNWMKYLRFALDKLPRRNGASGNGHAPTSSVPTPPY